jgi:hypothetical protein
MGEILRDYPFTTAFALVALGGAAWFGASFWGLVGALVGGAIVGGIIDQSRKENRNKV